MLTASTDKTTEELTINTNNETINKMKSNELLMEALTAIVLSKVKLQHQQRAEMSLDALYFL